MKSRLCVLVLLFMFVMPACSGEEDSQQNAQQPPVPIKSMVVKRQDQHVTRQYTGITAGFREIEVRAQVSGILLKRDYKEGGKVSQSQSLFQIDPAPYQADLLRAESSLKQAQARLKNAQLEYNRVIPLYEKNAVSQKVRDEAVAALDTAKADVGAANAEVRIAKINLGYTKVYAPITGVSSKEAISEGSLIATGDLLTRITQYDPIYVHFSPSNTEIFNLQKMLYLKQVSVPEEGMEVNIFMPDGKRYMESGRVDFSDSMVDPNTGTVHMRAIFNNPHNLIFPGQYVKVVISGSYLLDVIVVPQRALLQTEKGTMVWVIDRERKVKLQLLEVGMTVDTSVVVTSGLSDGQEIVVEGINKLSADPNLRVQPEPYVPESTVDTGGADDAGENISDPDNNNLDSAENGV